MAFFANMISAFDDKAMSFAVFMPPPLRPIKPNNTDSYVGMPDVRQASLLGRVMPRPTAPSFILTAQADKKPVDTIPINRTYASKPSLASQDEQGPGMTTFHSRAELRQYLQLTRKVVAKGADNFEMLKAARVLVLFGNQEEKRAGLDVLFKMTRSDDESYRIMAGRFLILEGKYKIDEGLRLEVGIGLLTSTNAVEKKRGENILIELAFRAKNEDVQIQSAEVLVGYTQVTRASMEMGVKALYNLALKAKKEERRLDAASSLVLSINEAARKKGVAAMRHLATRAKSDNIRSRALRSLGEFQK